MQAFAIDKFGVPGSVRELPDPKPEAEEILVRVEAAGVNVVDVWVVQGGLKDMREHRFPLVPGVEGAGVIEAIGSDVSGLAQGDRVYGVSVKPFFGSGTFAELATFTSDGIALAPTSIDSVGAACIPHTALTALAAIDEVGPNESKKILVVGSTGGVGSYVTQLAARLGANVIAVARAENADYARSLGASESIDYSKGDLVDQVRSHHPDGVDAIIDLFNDGATLARLSELVRRGGHVVSTVGAADPELLSQRGLQGVNVSRADPARLAEITRLVDGGELQVSPTRAFPLQDAVSALATLQDGHVRGKLVIQPM